MCVSRHWQLWPSCITRPEQIQVVLLRGSTDVERSLPPMADGEAFEDVMVDLSAGRPGAGATVAVLMGGD